MVATRRVRPRTKLRGVASPRQASLHPALAAASGLLPAVVAAVGPNCEVVLHDFSRLPNSIVALSGNVTGRTVGGPMTDFGLELIRSGATNEDILGYETYAQDGRRLRSSTTFVRDAAERIIGCICINFDVSSLLSARSALDAVLTPTALSDTHSSTDAKLPIRETFAASVEELTVRAVREEILRMDVPVELMQKRHKLEVVKRLDERGLFLIRDAVDYVAAALATSRYTIYKYLSQLQINPTAAPSGSRRATNRALPGVQPPGSRTAKSAVERRIQPAADAIDR